MALPSLTTILSVVFLGYMFHSIHSIYLLFTPPTCPVNNECIHPYLAKQGTTELQLFVFTSLKGGDSPRHVSQLTYLHHADLDITKNKEINLNISLPRQTRNNGSLYMHVFLASRPIKGINYQQIIHNPYAVDGVIELTTHMVPQADTFNLLGASKDPGPNAKEDKPVTHWRRKVFIGSVTESVPIPKKEIPGEIFRYLKVSPNGEYLPFFYMDKLSLRVGDLELVTKKTDVMPVTLIYNPMSFGQLRLMTQIELAMEAMKGLGFSEKDIDEVKSIFADTHIYLLLLTFVVSTLHILFDFLAFKNDIAFWRRKKTMVGLSSRTVVWRAVSHGIIFFYLLDENTNMLVLVPAGIGTLIEIWKVKKAFKITIYRKAGIFPWLKFGLASEEEKKTEVYDAQSMRYLSWVLYPLCIVGALYSLIYMPHKSWYSWTLQSMVNGVYAFGFLFMLPQLFVNYQLKSVAHLPWRSFMYKAFNTFIDDVFAFIITMPTAHRVACFRDDVVFLIYLYQRWLYPVDKARVNEFGESFDEDGEKKKTK